tara:strand:- start:2631 stop:3479 length:849 start_codon:yes stop_codon:yes gene_type:complete
MKRTLLKLCLCLSICAGGFVVAPDVQANILITPTRVVFEGRERFASVTLANNGDKARTYNIDWVYFKMNEGDGTYKVEDAPPTDFDLSKYLVYSPRRVTLAPGASQKVKLALRRPNEIPEGDYHVHLRFAVDPEMPEDIIEHQGRDIQKGEGRSGAAIRVNVSYSIPVILIVGKPDVEARIGALSLKRNENTGGLSALIPVERVGKPYSILGHMYVYHVDDKGNEDKVGEISNAHIFAEANNRVFDVSLIKEISGGSLRVVLDRYDDQSGKTPYAEKTFPLE